MSALAHYLSWISYVNQNQNEGTLAKRVPSPFEAGEGFHGLRDVVLGACRLLISLAHKGCVLDTVIVFGSDLNTYDIQSSAFA